MPARYIAIGEPAHDAERQALRHLVSGLPDTYTVYGNPWIVQRNGQVFEVDAVVAAPHAIFVVEIKSYRGRIVGNDTDWYAPEPMRSPIRLNRKTAQILGEELRRKSVAAGRPWVEGLVFLSHTDDIDVRGPASTGRVHSRHTILSAIRDKSLLERRLYKPLVPVDAHAATILERLMRGAPQIARPPRKIREYQLETVLDRTDRYTEYLARHELLGDRRVLRVYPVGVLDDDTVRQRAFARFQWEAQVLRKVSIHPGILSADAAFADADHVHLCLPFEHFTGLTLASWISKYRRDVRGNRGLTALVALWRRFADAVAFAHRQGVVHRLLRSDVMLVEDRPIAASGELAADDLPDIRLAGFEVAKRLAAHTTVHIDSSLGEGRLAWAAPEVVHNFSDATPLSDQFGLGAMLGYLLAGRPLFNSTRELLGTRSVQGLGVRVRDHYPSVPGRLEQVVERMLQIKPSKRYDNVAEAIESAVAAARQSEAGPAVTSAVTGGGPAASEPARRLDPENLRPGQQIGRDYEIRSRLGHGGLSTVYEALHLVSGRVRALKIARPEAAAENALRAEHQILDPIDHANIVRVIDLSGIIPDRLTLVMERVAGKSLAHWLPDNPDPPLALLRKLSEHLLSALAYLEARDLIHKDIKPDNLIVGDDRLTLIDFSLVECQPENLFVGTAMYKDPALRAWTPAQDRYAAALCLFELFTARHPFGNRAPEPDELPDIDEDELTPAGLYGFFQRALHPDPTARYPSAAAMRADFVDCLGQKQAPKKAKAAAESASASASASESATASAPAPEPPAEPPIPLAVLAERSLAASDLSDSIVATLRRAGIHTNGDLVALSAHELRRTPGLGKSKLRRIKQLQKDLRRAGVPATTDLTLRTAIAPDLVDDTTPVADLALAKSLADALARAGFTTVGRLASAARDELAALADVGPGRVDKIASALHAHKTRPTSTVSSAEIPVGQEISPSESRPDSLAAAWNAASRDIDHVHPQARALIEHIYGLDRLPLPLEEAAATIDLTDAARIHEHALDRLHLASLAEPRDLLEQALADHSGVLDLGTATLVVCRPWGEPDQPTRELAAGVVRVLAALDAGRMHLAGDLDDGRLEVLLRPTIDRQRFVEFLETARAEASWPPSSPDASHRTLQALLPGVDTDLLALVERLLGDVRRTQSGELFQTPVDIRDAIAYVLERTRQKITATSLREAVTRAFSSAHLTGYPEPDHLLPTLRSILTELPGWRLVAPEPETAAADDAPPDPERISLEPIGQNSVSAPAPLRDAELSPDLVPSALINLPAERTQGEVARDLLIAAAERGGWRLVITPPEHHPDLGRSLARAMGADCQFISFEHRLLARIEKTGFDRFERASRYAAQRRKLTREADALMSEILRERGSTGAVTVLGDTGIFELCNALHLCRTLYNQTHTGNRGFFALVIPGSIHERQPKFNEHTPVFPGAGSVIPIYEPVPVKEA